MFIRIELTRCGDNCLWIIMLMAEASEGWSLTSLLANGEYLPLSLTHVGSIVCQTLQITRECAENGVGKLWSKLPAYALTVTEDFIWYCGELLRDKQNSARRTTRANICDQL